MSEQKRKKREEDEEDEGRERREKREKEEKTKRAIFSFPSFLPTEKAPFSSPTALLCAAAATHTRRQRVLEGGDGLRGRGALRRQQHGRRAGNARCRCNALQKRANLVDFGALCERRAPALGWCGHWAALSARKGCATGGRREEEGENEGREEGRRRSCSFDADFFSAGIV